MVSLNEINLVFLWNSVYTNRYFSRVSCLLHLVISFYLTITAGALM